MIPYGWAVFADDSHLCIAHPSDKRRMLCGRWRRFVPVVPPSTEGRTVCADCLAAWEALPVKPEPVEEFGSCPACGGEVVLVDGLIAGHGMWVRTRAGLQVLPEPCSGEGMTPVGEGLGEP